MTKMSKSEASNFINDELWPMMKISEAHAIETLSEDCEALEIALTLGNDCLVFAMANWISQARGLQNGEEVARKVTALIFA